MPDDYVIPNFQNKTVSYAKSQTSPRQVGLKIKTPENPTWHDPDTTELSLTIAANAANSPPGTTKTSGEWVGVEIGPI